MTHFRLGRNIIKNFFLISCFFRGPGLTFFGFLILGMNWLQGDWDSTTRGGGSCAGKAELGGCPCDAEFLEAGLEIIDLDGRHRAMDGFGVLHDPSKEADLHASFEEEVEVVCFDSRPM